jgi:hypothetical protein
VSNVKKAMEAQNSIPLLTLQDLLQETCALKIAVVSSLHAEDKNYKKVQKIIVIHYTHYNTKNDKEKHK